jgi:hypothetical protein
MIENFCGSPASVLLGLHADSERHALGLLP